MLSKKFLLIPFMLVGIMLFSGCKSDKSPEDVFGNSGEDIHNYYVLSVTTGLDGTEVVCSRKCSYLPSDKNYKDAYQCKYDNYPVYVTKAVFDSNPTIQKYLTTMATVVKDKDAYNAFKSMFEKAVSDKESGYYNAKIGNCNDICNKDMDKYYVIGIVHSLTYNEYSSDTSTPTWVEYVNNKEKVWKDTKTGRFWASGSNIQAKDLLEAMDYCENLTYAGFNDWVLPNKEIATEMNEHGNILPRISVITDKKIQVWVSQKIDAGLSGYYDSMVYNESDSSFSVLREQGSKKLGVMCTR